MSPEPVTHNHPLLNLYRYVTAGVDGENLVAQAAIDGNAETTEPLAVLAFGKVSLPMLRGLVRRFPKRPLRGLAVVPESRADDITETLVASHPNITFLVADHPEPSARSLAAGEAALAFVSGLGPNDQLAVLVSGGGSSLLCQPAAGLSRLQFLAATSAVARGGATIGELNTVRKHLSAIKGGQLGRATQARTSVWMLSDVVGNDPATIASGPFVPDETTYADALKILGTFSNPDDHPEAMAVLTAGVQGDRPETVKAADGSLNHITATVLAGPTTVLDLAQAWARKEGVDVEVLAQNTEAPVDSLAKSYAKVAIHAAQASDVKTTRTPRLLIGNGEPTIQVRGNGTGGRALHLAALVATEFSGQSGLAFLAAGTDDRDGNSHVNGGFVTGETVSQGVAKGLDAEAAIGAFDTGTYLDALGATVRGPGTSNLLDLHAIWVP